MLRSEKLMSCLFRIYFLVYSVAYRYEVSKPVSELKQCSSTNNGTCVVEFRIRIYILTLKTLN